MSTPKEPKRRRRWARWILLLLFIAGFADYFAYPYGGELGGRSWNTGENGLWIRYTWYFGEHSPAEVADLGRKLTQEQIRYAYFHVRFIGKDGRLHFRHPESAGMIRSLRAAAPGVRPIAWVYVDGTVDLGDAGIRGAMVGEAKWLVETCGFDGVQWDVEPCPDGSRGFLALLEETRKALPRRFLSVAPPTWFPWPAGGFGWSEAYFGEVGKRCDQIAVMCYDTGFVTPRSYAWLVGQQTARVPKAAGCQVLFGLPTYANGGRSHNPRAENLRIGLKAIRESAGVAGVALFADYTTDAEEWAWYDRAWLGRR